MHSWRSAVGQAWPEDGYHGNGAANTETMHGQWMTSVRIMSLMNVMISMSPSYVNQSYSCQE
jgi:hypothetical protein